MLPDGWSRAGLSELIAELEAGVSVNSEARPARCAEIGVLKTSAVTYGLFAPDEHKAVLPEDVGRVRTSPKKDSIIISRMNTQSLVGASAFVDRDYPNLFLPDRLWQTVLRNPTALCARWLSYVLGSPATRERLSAMATGTSGSMKNLSKEQVLSLEVSVPPLQEQRKIAAILSSVDDTIEKTEAVIDQLEVVKKGLLGQTFSVGISQPRTAKEHPELGVLPEHWEVRRLDTLVAPGTSITYGIVQAGPEVPGGVPYIRTGDVRDEGVDVGALRHTAPDIAAKFKRSEVRTGDLVYCIRASVGAVVKVGPELDGANLTQGTARLASGTEVDSEFLLWALRAPNVRAWVDQQCKGSTFREITLAKLRETPIPFPPRVEQERIATLFSALAHRVASEKRALEALRAVKASLLESLLSGRVRVKTPQEEAA